MAKHPAKCPKCGQRVDFDSAVGEVLICPGCGASLKVPPKPTPPDDPLIGQSLGEFEVLSLIGRGGMGAVYKGRQPALDRFVAIKVLPQQFATDASFLERFNREARAAAALSHPHIIQVFTVGQDKGHEFIAMELVDGEPLSSLLKREGRVAPDRALELMKQVASALAEAHGLGILHRDIKPANILLDSKGRAKVADFGLAKHTGVDVSVTATNQVLGTPLYLPPEGARGHPLDARSDLYSLGATFYQAIAGKPPFDGATPTEVIVKHLESEVPPLGQLAPDAPAALCRAIHRLLRKSPGDRYQTANELLEALSRVALAPSSPLSHGERGGVRVPSDAPTKTQPGAQRGAAVPHRPSDEREAAKRRRNRTVLLAALAAGLLVLVLALVLGGKRGRVAQPPSAVSPGPPTPATQHPTPDSPAEGEAASLFASAERTASEGKWLSTQHHLGRLAKERSATRFYAANRAAIEALAAKVAAALKSTPTPKVEPTPEPAEEWTTLPNGWRVGKPVNPGPTVNSTAIEMDPFVSADGLTLLLQSDRPGGQGGRDLWMSTRRSTDQPWAPPVNLGSVVNTSSGEGQPCLSSDGLTLWFGSDRPGGQGRGDLWVCTRGSLAEPWRAPQNLGPTVNSSSSDDNPCLAGDGLALMFSSNRPGGLGGWDFWICTRRSTGEPWGAPANLGPAINCPADDGCPCLSADGLTLIFDSPRPGGHGGADLWISARRTRTEPFGEPVNLGPTVNSSSDDGGAALSADGRTLYFCSYRPGGQGGHDLWQAPLLPPGAPLPDDEARWGPWEELFDGKSLDGWKVIEQGSEFLKHGRLLPGNGQLVFGKGDPATGIVWTRDVPRVDYEISLEALRQGGTGTMCDLIFPVKATGCKLAVGGSDNTVVCLDLVDGKTDVVSRPMAFQDGRWYRIRLRLTQSAIEAWVDDEKVVDFNPAGHKVSLNTPVVCMQPLGLRTWKTATAIRNLRLRRLKAEGAEAPKGGQWKVYTDWPFGAAEAKRRQEETAKALGVKVEQDIDLGGGVKMTFVLIPAGEFPMGSPPTTSPEQLQKPFDGQLWWYEREFPQHRVRITRPFWLGKTEVTQEQWQTVMGNNPSKFKGLPQNPVEKVNWKDCQGFLPKLSAMSGKAFRLPTEAEWEYARRAGAASELSFGDDKAGLGDYAWWKANSGDATHPVGKKKPNPWGLHDMLGNVWEWCEDVWHNSYEGAPTDGSAWVEGGDQSLRVVRGGAWHDSPSGCRSAARAGDPPTSEVVHDGCRVVLQGF